ncbi:MAG: hypothetical protein AAF787_20760, partial [Chloroflexota bacterium]
YPRFWIHSTLLRKLNWSCTTMGLSQFEIEDQVLLEPIWDRVQTIFTVSVHLRFMLDFAQFMEGIFRCYDGYISFEYALFDSTNIRSITDYVPQPPFEND